MTWSLEYLHKLGVGSPLGWLWAIIIELAGLLDSETKYLAGVNHRFIEGPFEGGFLPFYIRQTKLCLSVGVVVVGAVH